MFFTGESAATAANLPTWWNCPDIHYRSSVSRRRRRTLQAVTVAGVMVPQVRARHVTGGLKSGLNQCTQVSGLAIVPNAVIIADTAALSHPVQAFVVACSILAVSSNFSRRAAGSRAREQQVRTALLEEVRKLKGRRGYRIATAVITHADAGCESPAEAGMLWSVKCLLPAKKAQAVRTQHRISVGQTAFYLDVCLPETRSALEADGALKFGTSAHQFSSQANHHVTRHQQITEAGWTMSHMTAKEIGSLDLVRLTHERMVSAGFFSSSRTPVRSKNARRPRPSGWMYRPLTHLQVSKDRRF